MALSTNLTGFAGYPVAQELSEEFGMPAYLDNDANVAGLAEALVGAGKGLNTVFYVTISTGIGGVLVVNGKTVSGMHGFGGEVANIIIAAIPGGRVYAVIECSEVVDRMPDAVAIAVPRCV